MIDVFNVTKFDRTDRELQEFALLAVAVAGKTATTTARAVDQFVRLVRRDTRKRLPFDAISAHPDIEPLLREARIGQYGRIKAAYLGLATLDLRTCSTEDLEAIPGIGPKTARYFLLHSRKGQRFFPLDTHLLKFVRSLGKPAPKQTPASPKQYARIERVLLREADRRRMAPAKFDLWIWSRYARKEAVA